MGYFVSRAVHTSVMGGLMFWLCFFLVYCYFSLFFHFSIKTGQQLNRTRIGGMMTLTWKELRPDFAEIVEGFRSEGNFTTLLIDSLPNQQP